MTGVQYKIRKEKYPTGNLMPIEISYQIMMIFGDSVLLGGFELGDEVFDVIGADKNVV